MRHRFILIQLGLLLWGVIGIAANPNAPPSNQIQPVANSSLTTEIAFDYDTGIPTKLTFDVKSDRKKIWLGISLYPKEYADPFKEGEHFQVELNSDRSGRTVKLGKKYFGGYFEAAIWGKKVMRGDCTIPDCYWCAKNGFHLDELLFYKTGPLWLAPAE